MHERTLHCKKIVIALICMKKNKRWKAGHDPENSLLAASFRT